MQGVKVYMDSNFAVILPKNIASGKPKKSV